jgi:pectate lyase
MIYLINSGLLVRTPSIAAGHWKLLMNKILESSNAPSNHELLLVRYAWRLSRKVLAFFFIILGLLTIACLGDESSGSYLVAGEKISKLAEPLAFPGAEGFGAQSIGGRYGRVIEVTNLDDSGPGSLRAAVDARGPRIVVFRIGGTIELLKGLIIDNPYITIAGQTAVGGGIILKNHPSNKKATIYIKTHDVIIRYIRSRPGPSLEATQSLDALRISGYRVIVDHCSFSWATDEVVSMWRDARDISIQWSIIAEGLNNSTHLEGSHSKGLLIKGAGNERISIHHNLFAHNKRRNPRINAGGIVDVVNNVIYNSGGTGSTVGSKFAVGKVNYVGNYLKHGPNSASDYLVSTKGNGSNGFELYVEGNISPRRQTADLDERLVVKPRSHRWLVESPHAALPVTTTTALEAYHQVLSKAGATLPARDAVDTRIVADVLNGAGNIIDDPSEVGGWQGKPGGWQGKPPVDADHDGMPDAWESQFGFNPSNPAEGNGDADNDGYTNVEEYLNGTIPK